jgi:sperm-associated antigen 16 protein
MEPTDEELQVLERVELSDDSDDDFTYAQLTLDDEDENGSSTKNNSDNDEIEDEDLETALASIQAGSAEPRPPHAGDPSMKTHPRTAVRPSVVDDFIRNFLIARQMKRTLDEFNTEWYEKQAKGQLKEEDIGVVPDIYLRNLELDEQVKSYQQEVEKMKSIADKAQGTWDKFRKERDFHRMHHKRVVQEKQKLVVDMKRLRKHYAAYEPTMEQLREKYEVAMKEKMLMRLEKDRMVSKVEALEAHVRSLEQAQAASGGGAPQSPEGKKMSTGGSQLGGGGSKLGRSTKENRQGGGAKGGRRRRKGADIPLPDDSNTENPYWNLQYEPASAASASLAKTFKGHANAVSCVAFHPKKQICATASDDETWKLWAMPTGDLIMSGEVRFILLFFLIFQTKIIKSNIFLIFFLLIIFVENICRDIKIGWQDFNFTQEVLI